MCNNVKAIIDTCPVCGTAAPYEFTGSDYMFGTPGKYDYGRSNQCGAVFYPNDYEQYQPKQSWIDRKDERLRSAVDGDTEIVLEKEFQNKKGSSVRLYRLDPERE